MNCLPEHIRQIHWQLCPFNLFILFLLRYIGSTSVMICSEWLCFWFNWIIQTVNSLFPLLKRKSVRASIWFRQDFNFVCNKMICLSLATLRTISCCSSLQFWSCVCHFFIQILIVYRSLKKCKGLDKRVNLSVHHNK